MNFIIGGGGTGGHISPAIAIARELQSRGHSIAYIGNRDSLEESLITKQGIAFHPINVQKLYRKLTVKHFRFPFLLAKSIVDSIKIIRQAKASAVICTGGYISGPIAISALILRKPLYFWDGNSYPGLTTRMLASKMKAVFVAFETTKSRLKGANTVNTWIPVSEDFTIQQPWNPAQYRLTGTKPIILLTGGSQGSMALNQAFDKAVPALLQEGFELLWQTGKSQIKLYQNKYQTTAGVYMFGFSNEIPAMLQNSCLAITRAGAMTIAELQAAKLPAILIPLPTAAENHQYFNALEQDRKGVARLLPQKDLSGDLLLEAIHRIIKDKAKYKQQLEAFPPNNSAQEITDYILQQISAKGDLRC